MSRPDSHAELRLVVLGRTGAGRRSAVSSILSLQDGQQGTEACDTRNECSKVRGEAAGREVAVVSGPDWFSSDCAPGDRRRHLSALVALSSPGPHAFLLCVPVNQPADAHAKALDVLEALFGPSAVGERTIVLFTHLEELEEDEPLEGYLATWRKDLRALLERCGGRYHTLERRGGGPEEGRAVEELLEKVEGAAGEGGARHFSCPLYEEAETRVRRRQVELAGQSRGEELRDDQPAPTASDEDVEGAREEAERSVGDLDVDVESFFPPAVAPPPALVPAFLWGLWEKLTGCVRRLPAFVRREALLGALVGLFVGGPLGGMAGAAVGSVATEVRRRKSQKTK